MPVRLLARIVVGLVLVGGRTVLASAVEEPRCGASIADLQALARARSVRALEGAYRRVDAHDSCTEIVHAVRLAQLRPGPRADNALVAAIPASSEEAHRAYTMTWPEPPCRACDDSLQAFLPLVAASALRVPDGLATLVRFRGRPGDSDWEDQLARVTSSLATEHPVEFRRMLTALPVPERIEACNMAQGAYRSACCAVGPDAACAVTDPSDEEVP